MYWVLGRGQSFVSLKNIAAISPLLPRSPNITVVEDSPFFIMIYLPFCSIHFITVEFDNAIQRHLPVKSIYTCAVALSDNAKTIMHCFIREDMFVATLFPLHKHAETVTTCLCSLQNKTLHISLHLFSQAGKVIFIADCYNIFY